MDNQTSQFLNTTFAELALIKKKEKNIYRFNEKLSLRNSVYFKLFNKLMKDNNNRFEINKIIAEYLKPPYGFPKIVTFLMLLSLVHMQKFIFISPDIEISSLNEIKNCIGFNAVSYTHLTLPTTPYV